MRSVRILFWLYLFFLVLGQATVTNPADPDLWHRLALGEYLWENGHFPPGGTFSYLADYQHIADHEWGSALFFYGISHWGSSVFVGMKLITLALTISFLGWAGLRQRKPSPLLAAFYGLILLALLPSFQSTVRCMTFTHVFFALWLYWFQCERQGSRTYIPTYLYVLTMIVWANLHGGFVIGLFWLLAVGVVMFIYGEPWKRWALRFGLCSLATIINPFGWQLWYSTGRALLSSRQGFEEWAPVSWWPKVMSYPGYKILLIALVVGLALEISRRGWKRMDRPIVLLVGLFVVISLTSARHTSLLATVAGALAPGLFPAAPKISSILDPIQRLGYMALSIFFVLIPLFSILIVLPGDGLRLVYESESCPVGAVNFLKREQIQGKLLVPFNYGSYALWQLRGQMKVSMDGRYDLAYRIETYRRVSDFFYAKGDWRSLLTTPEPNAILVPIVDAVYPKLRKTPGWIEVYQDKTDAVFLPRF